MAHLWPVGSAVANVFRSSAPTPRQADVVAHAMPPAQQSEAVAYARSVTLRRLEDEHEATSTAAGTITFAAPPEAAIVFRLALDAVRVHLAAQSAVRPQTSDALLFMLKHAIAAWTEQGAQFRDYADFERDGSRRTAPGCTARRSLQSHHVVFRRTGGTDEAWNRTALCAFHHLRGVHAHTVSCRGRAPEGLLFELGVRASGAPPLRAGVGDVLLGA
jgi:hypothetical protein